MKDLITAAVVAVVSLVVAAIVGGAAAPAAVDVAGVSVVWWVVAVCFGVNWLAWIPASALRSERFYDLTGSITFVSVTGFVVFVAARAPAVPLTVPRLLPAVFVVVWTVRLGSFLVARIHRAGKDGRFDALKTSPVRFFVPWTLQGLWVLLTSLAMVVQVTATAESPAPSPPPLPYWAPVAGALLWLAGFTIEVVADAQKAAFASNEQNRGRFLTTGLWAWSRHPNYFGETLLWTGVFVMGVQDYAGGQWVAVVSPLFVFVLLRFVSGVPLLERRADARWGDDPAYVAWRDATPVLFLRPPRRR
jgi:steroid 5-alpha reductase family enzyme